MPVVQNSVVIQAPLAIVYAIAQDAASYPDFIRDVQSVTVIERDGDRLVCDYVALIPQFLLRVRWRQEEVWDNEARSSKFQQLDGDYDRMSGTWSFTEEGGAVRFDQMLDYEYNVPTLGPLVKKVIQAVVVKNLENIGQAIKARAEKAVQ